MRWLLPLVLISTLSCASLVTHPTDGVGALAGKVLVRTVLIFPTLGVSELFIGSASDAESLAGYGEALETDVRAGRLTESDAAHLYNERLIAIQGGSANRGAIWGSVVGAAARSSR